MSDFSTKQYGWKDLTIAYGGRVVDGVTNVEYSKKKEKSFLRGRGDKPWGILSGNYDFEGKLELWQSEVVAMERDAPGEDILNLEFDVTVAYIPEDGGETLIKTLKGVQITEYTEGMQQGDTHKLIELPIMFRDIKKHI
jgi:hypothetical protein